MLERRTFQTKTEIMGVGDRPCLVLNYGHKARLEEVFPDLDLETVEVNWTTPSNQQNRSELYLVYEEDLLDILQNHSEEPEEEVNKKLLALLVMGAEDLDNVNLSMPETYVQMFKGKAFTPQIITKLTEILEEVKFAKRQSDGLQMMLRHVPKSQVDILNQVRVAQNRLPVDQIASQKEAQAQVLIDQMNKMLGKN